MSKVLYVFQPHSIVDIITNSSSELFVFKGKTKKIVRDTIKGVYPNYRKEYDTLLNITELSAEELNSFMYHHCGADMWPVTRTDSYRLIGDYTFDELYEPDGRGPAWNGAIQYQLRDNTRPPKKITIKKFNDFNSIIDPYGEEDWNNDDLEQGNIWRRRAFVTEDNKEEVINRIDPEHKMFFLYSLDQNPNWDYQKKLMDIGNRYHLG